MISRYFFGKNELYFGSLLVLFGFVCVFIKYPKIKYPKFLIALAGCSTYIYIFHDMISKILRAFYTLFNVSVDSSIVLKNFHPIIVCVISTVFAYCLNKIQGCWRAYKNNIRYSK